MIGFGVRAFKMPIEEVKDMTWAEFQLRSFQYWEDRKRENMLFREVAYWSYCSMFSMSKERPKPKKVFWPIDGEVDKNMVDRAAMALRKAREEYLKNKKK